ncbi:MAG: DUF3667 domain-containing protein [Jejuia sp.]
MNCKNCGISLRTDYCFCPDCGAKVIRNRLSIKGLLYDFFERYFNLDNTFFKTIGHMVVKPQEVCSGYIGGLRKKYLNPVSMLAIALTVSGFTIFLMKKIAWEDIDFSKISYAQKSSDGLGTEKIMSASMEYSSLLYFLYIPVIAIGSYLVFNKKNYNLAEHIVTSIYALTSFSIISFLYTGILLMVSPQTYINTALLYVFIMILFCLYVSYKNSLDNIKSLVWRIPSFLFLILIGYIGISIFQLIILLVTGDISIQDFIPKK